MEITTSGHIDWPLFNALISKQKITYKLFPVDLQIIRTTFDTFCTQCNACLSVV